MKNLLDTILFNGYTTRDAIIFVEVALVFLIFIRMVMKAIMKKETRPHIQTVDCSNCGWQGNVSRFAGRCPQCNQPLGDLTAQPKKPYGL